MGAQHPSCPRSLHPRRSSGTEIASPRAGSQRVAAVCLMFSRLFACSDAFFSYLSHICLPRRVLTSQGDFGTVSACRDGEREPAAPCPCTSPASRSLSQQLFCSASANPPFGLKAFARRASSACFLLCWGLLRRIEAPLNHFRDKYTSLLAASMPGR